MSAAFPPRHTLVWPNQPGRDHLRSSAPAPVIAWIEAGGPLVLRRRGPGDPPDAWPLALSMPGDRADMPLRVAVTLPAAGIARHAPPPTLAALLAAGSLPAPWHARTDALLALGRRHGASPRVFGGALWQHLSGQPRLHPGSDLDLLWFRDELPSAAALSALLAALLELPDHPPRLDGELLFPDGSGIQWRELATAAPADEVLLKTPDGLRLVPVRTLLRDHVAA